MNFLARRRAEEQRVDAFLAAIVASEHGVPAQPETHDTAPLPLSLVRLLVAAAAAVVLAGCAAPARMPMEQSSRHAIVTTTAPAPVEQSTGTDAGLITEPAPTVQELEEQDAAADSIPVDMPAPVVSETPAPAAPVDPAPAPPAVDLAPPAPVVEEEPPGTQLPEEQLGSYRCPDPAHVVLSVDPWTCGPAEGQ